MADITLHELWNLVSRLPVDCTFKLNYKWIIKLKVRPTVILWVDAIEYYKTLKSLINR